MRPKGTEKNRNMYPYLQGDYNFWEGWDITSKTLMTQSTHSTHLTNDLQGWVNGWRTLRHKDKDPVLIKTPALPCQLHLLHAPMSSKERTNLGCYCSNSTVFHLMLSNQNISSRQNYQTVHLTNRIHLTPLPQSGLWYHLHPMLRTDRLALAQSFSLFQPSWDSHCLTSLLTRITR